MKYFFFYFICKQRIKVDHILEMEYARIRQKIGRSDGKGCQNKSRQKQNVMDMRRTKNGRDNQSR